QNGSAICAPTLLVKSNFKPGRPGTARDVVNAYDLSGCRCRPIRIALRNTIDRLVVNVDELVNGRAGWIDTEDLGISVLYAGTNSGTNPVVEADHNREIPNGFARRRPPKFVTTPVDLLYFPI